LERIIDKALEKDRDLRYQSAAELRADLKRLRRDSASGRVSTRYLTATEPLWQKFAVYGATALAVLVVIAAAVLFSD
jgi:eukaryotic-like serine/threonine-protein kinase